MYKKKIFWLGAFLLCLFISIFCAAYQRGRELFLFKKSVSREMEQLSVLENKYQNDRMGSTTPEGTIEMFKNYLVHGDIRPASELFLPEFQNMYFKELTDGYNKAKLEFLISDLERPFSKIIISQDMVRLRTQKKGDIPSFTFDLIRNPYTNIWKIREL